ncbi:GTP-binding protein [Ramlibacter pallidus]|uniref:ATP/GTP-binding protein n=1 Tax=Ramlibacter pallidus TaxID=2780087 RepID=A0ABR9S4E9_9BURK|nr:ATP/GTP-binding protein [Ramlibacter pallidus]MBE7368395.1 ATP/GTP-binding protein [Ramlibacter pallidus]
MREHKILFTGTMGAGKTTAIGAVSEVPPVVTEVANNDASVAKATTTVGFDFGLLTLDNGDRLRLFGTPGQLRFDFLWKILATNALGIVVLVDNSRPAPLEDLQAYVDGFAEQLRRLPCVVGVGRLSTHPSPGLDAYAEHLGRQGLAVPLLDVDVRRRDDVVLLLDTLLAQVEADLMGMDE